MSNADTILMRCAGHVTQAQWAEIQKLAAEAGAGGIRGGGNKEETYVYFDLKSPRAVTQAEINALEGKVSALAGGAGVSGVALKMVEEKAGVSVGHPAPVHYVVEMEFAEGSLPELTKWYTEEHIPGLASVEGCVHIRRYMSEAGRSFACYELGSNLIPETPAWMKWRETPWTLKVREHYRNMKRGLFLKL